MFYVCGDKTLYLKVGEDSALIKNTRYKNKFSKNTKVKL
jgi:hypothetical protein